MIGDLLVEEQKKKLEDKLSKVEDIKQKAVEDINGGRYEKAIDQLQSAVNILNNITTSSLSTGETKDEVNNRKAGLFNNIALCYMQLDEPKRVVEYTSRVIGLAGVKADICIKAYVRRGKIIYICVCVVSLGYVVGVLLPEKLIYQNYLMNPTLKFSNLVTF